MRTIKYLLIIAIISTFAAYSYAGMEDSSDRLSSSQSNVFSPGYINATMQKTREIISQASKNRSPIEKASELAKDNLSDNVTEDNAAKITPELKRKTGPAIDNTQNTTTASVDAIANESIEPKVIESTQYSVGIGSGINQTLDSSGKLMAEVIDGQRYVYAGFDGMGSSTIAAAISTARSGDIVYVHSGTYYEHVTLSNGVNLIGEDSATTIIHGNYQTQSNVILAQGNNRIENLTISGSGLYSGYPSSAVKIAGNNVTIKNNNITDNRDYALHIWSGANILIDNNFFKDNYLAVQMPNSGTTIQNNTFVNNSQAINILNGPAPIIRNNIFTGSTFQAIYEFSYSAKVAGLPTNGYAIVEGNIFYNNAGGTGNVPPAMVNQTNGNIIFNTDPGFVDPSAGNYAISESSSIFGKGFDTNFIIKTTTIVPYISPSTTLSGNNSLSSDYSRNIFSLSAYGAPPYESLMRLSSNPLTQDAISSIFKGLLANKEALSAKVMEGEGGLNKDLVSRLVDNILGEQSLSMPLTGQERNDEMSVALSLANILKNPTGDQKLILDAMQALLAETDQSVAQSPDAKKAQDDLLQAVASILIAQAIPDLFKEGDMTNIRIMFQDLNTQKEKLMTEYSIAADPYYKEVKKILAKNLALLQLNNIVSKGMMTEELEKLQPNEIDKIFEKLRKSSIRSSEEEYILQQEAKYRKAYLDPNKKLLEDKMKLMMREFTQKISKVLEVTKK